MENYTAALAAEFVRVGHWVEVFAPTRDLRQGNLATRRKARPQGFGLTRVAVHQEPRNPAEALDPLGVAARFGEWLDRERPDVVHFQHVIKLGLGLIEEAHQRAIPIVYTAHDFYPVCHRYTLLRPDLTVCPDPAAADVCARCDLATAVLNAVPGIGDYQMGVAPDELPPAAAARLAGVLTGDPVEAGGFHADEWQRAREDRAKLDERREQVFGLVDLCVVPSRFMGAQMQASGMSRIEYLPYGIPLDDLQAVAAKAPVGSARAPRFGFIGGLSKHKGVDVLLDAFGSLMRKHPAAASLTIYGYSSDATYVDRLARRAGEVGARWKGAYERAELPEILANLDVIIVPSTWYENAPIAIREALAAGRPVVASRLGALGESVQDEVDGLLFEPGDSDDLARVLERLLEPAELARLASGIEPVVTMETNAQQLMARYLRLVEANEERIQAEEHFSTLPASMAAFTQAVASLERAPLRELFEHVSGALGNVGRSLGVDEKWLRGDHLLTRAFADGDEAQRNLRDSRHEVEWLRTALAGAEDSNRSHADFAAWSEATLADRDATIASLRAELDELRKGRAADADKLAWLEGLVAESSKAQTALEERAAWLETNLAGETEAREALKVAQQALTEEVEWLRSTKATLDEEAEWLRTAKAALDEEVEWLRRSRAELEAERDWLRDEQLPQLEAKREASLAKERTRIAELEQGVAELEQGFKRKSARWAGLVERFTHALADATGGRAAEVPPKAVEAGPLVDERVAELQALIADWRWRRAEMQAAEVLAEQLGARRFGNGAYRKSGLAKRVAGWAQHTGYDGGQLDAAEEERS